MAQDLTRVVTLEQYLNLITSAHNQQPRYMATVALAILPYVKMVNDALSLPRLFDVDYAVGDQLDMIGEWVGVGRIVDIPLDIWFTWDTNSLGWDQGQWHVEYESHAQHVRLDDDHYRVLLKARIAANYWDGTLPGAYKAWDELFDAWGYRVLIQDGIERIPKDMRFLWDEEGVGWDQGLWHMPDIEAMCHGNMYIVQALLGPALTPVMYELFIGGYLDLKSAGVGTGYMIQAQPVQPDDGLSCIGNPIFAWDVGPDGSDPGTFPPHGVAGWDMGCFGQIVEPGQPWVPPLPPFNLPEAPLDNTVYGRENRQWYPALPIEGGTMEGPLITARKPVQDDEIANKDFADRTDGGTF